MGVSDVRGRLMRMHRILKKIWYLQSDDDCISGKVDDEDNTRFEETYGKLIRADLVSDNDRFWIELPFTFIMWREIEMIECLCANSSLQAATFA